MLATPESVPTAPTLQTNAIMARSPATFRMLPVIEADVPSVVCPARSAVRALEACATCSCSMHVSRPARVQDWVVVCSWSREVSLQPPYAAGHGAG